jgi:CPA2 family monovalent cation:H+ antiporter-2
MLDTHSLLFTIVASIVMAFIFGLMAKLARLPALVGYLIAGMMLGPHTPGLEADQNLASQLAEIGIILLMFGVGLHFSIKDLMRVRKVVVPCALIQLCVISSMGAWFLLNRTGVALAEAIAFGVSISAARF